MRCWDEKTLWQYLDISTIFKFIMHGRAAKSSPPHGRIKFYRVQAMPFGCKDCPSPSLNGRGVQHDPQPGGRLLQCQQCSFMTVLPSSANEQQRPHQCSHCGKAFAEEGSLVAHPRTHMGERPYRCHLCPGAFSHKSSLAAHLHRHSGPSLNSHREPCSNVPGRRQLRCQQCSYATLRSSHLKNHLRTHTGERPHQCSHCGKAFAEKGSLVTHLRVHTGERPYQCHLCPGAFAQKATLVNHLQSHTGERPFKCRFCPKAFTRRLQQRMHEEKAHSQHH
ncbi:uncharacterized protein LOC144160957 [Haemaphysalis longicornis]